MWQLRGISSLREALMRTYTATTCTPRGISMASPQLEMQNFYDRVVLRNVV